MIKKILIGLAVLVVLIIAAAVIVPFFIPMDSIKQELQAQVKEATGRDLIIDGDFKVKLLPEATIQAGNVRFQNAAGGSRADMVTLKELRVHVAILPLLSSRVEVKEFVLDQPDILLEVDKNGQANWAFKSAETGGGPGSGDGSGAGSDRLEAISLGDVRIVNGRIEYRDAQSGTAETLENVNLTVNLPSLDDPVSIEGDATWRKEALKLRVGAKSPRAIMAMGKTDVDIAVNGKPLKLTYGGALDLGRKSVAGKLDLDVPSVRGLAAWAGSPLEVKGEEVLNNLKLSGQVAASAAQAAITDMTLAIDKINTTGDLTAALGGAVPMVSGNLSVDALNLNPYLAAFGGGDASGSGQKPAGSNGSSDWSDEPIDMSALRSVNADLTLAVGSLQAQDIKVGKSQVRAQLQDGKLDLNLSEMALYDGNGTLQLNVDASGKTPAIKSTFTLSGLQAEPFLTDAARLEWLSGTAAMDMAVTTSGTSQKALANALGGSGKMVFADGAVRGTNIAALLRGISTLNLNPEAWESSKTDFAELGGTFTIKDGVLTNDDMALKSQLLRVTGAGTVDIGGRTIDYTAQPKLVGTLEGQGGAADIEGLPIGVRVTGSWDNPQTNYELGGGNLLDLAKDPEALVSTLSNLGAIKDPKALAERLGKIGGGGGVLEALQGLSGGSGSGSPADALKSLIPGATRGTTGNPADALKSLIPGLGGSRQQAPTTLTPSVPDTAAPAGPVPTVPETEAPTTPAPAIPETEKPATESPAPNQPTIPDPAGALKKLFGQ